MYGVGLDRLLVDRRLNARLAWAGVVATSLLGVAVVRERPLVAVLVTAAAVIAALPGPFYRSHRVTLPWEVVALLGAVATWLVLAPSRWAIAAFLASLAIVLGVELDLFTPLRISHRFVAVLVPIVTAAVTGALALLRWVLGEHTGHPVAMPAHDHLLLDFVAATVAGIAFGFLFELYVVHWEGRLDTLTPVLGDTDPRRNDGAAAESASGVDDAAKLLHRIERRYRPARVVQGVVAVVFVAALARGDTELALNSALGFTVIVTPALVERRGRVTVGPALGVLVALAVALHVLGAVEWPLLGQPYAAIPWYDHLTHAATASLVAAAGYGFVRAVDGRTDAIDLTPVAAAVVTLATVLAVGVYWEVLEFGVGLVGVGGALEQHGLADTMNDLAFDTVGGTAAAAWGAVRRRPPLALAA